VASPAPPSPHFPLSASPSLVFRVFFSAGLYVRAVKRSTRKNRAWRPSPTSENPLITRMLLLATRSWNLGGTERERPVFVPRSNLYGNRERILHFLPFAIEATIFTFTQLIFTHCCFGIAWLTGARVFATTNTQHTFLHLLHILLFLPSSHRTAVFNSFPSRPKDLSRVPRS